MRPLCLICIGFLFARCARETIIELPKEAPKIVAVCHFTSGQHFRVKVSISKSVNDSSDPVFPQNVDATLSVNGDFWDRLKPDTTEKEKITYWISNFSRIAKPGVNYVFSVRVPGYPLAQARGHIPPHTPLNDITLVKNDLKVVQISETQSELRVPLALHLSDAPAEGYYFAFNLTHETEVHDPPNVYSEEGRTNFLADGRTFSLLHDIPEPVVLVNENLWSDDRRTLYLTARIPFDPELERPRKIFIEWRTLSESFYRYHLSLSRQGGNLPFSDPDAVFNNVSDGYGNFSGYAVSVDTVLIPQF